MLGLRSKNGVDDRKSRRERLRVVGGIAVADDGYFHPTTEDEIVVLVRAVAENKRNGVKPDLIRVRGALHSFPHSITGIPLQPNVGAANPNPSATPTDGGKDVVAVSLDRYIGMTLVAPQDNKDPANDGNTWAVCQAGINMVQDPENPRSTVENGLSYQISQKMFALPDLGGIAAQTVSGFMSTGSSGGSLRSSLYDNVMAIRFVDGEGNVRACSRKVDPDLFFAAGVSMGLFGIITQVSFSLVPYFDVVGAEYTTTMAQCPYQTPWDPDHLSTDGKESKESKDRKDEKTGETLPTLVEFFNMERNEFCRLNWFPQPGVNRMITWTARKLRDYQPYNQQGPPLTAQNCVPYVEVGDEGSSKVTQALLQRVAGWLLGEQTGIDDTTPKSGIAKFAKMAEQFAYAEIIKAEFVNTSPSGTNVKNYHDWWWHCIPMDQQINYLIMPVVFTELWMPIQYTDQMMILFSQYFKKMGWVASGAFAFEVYTASRSDFWLSMSTDWPTQFQDPSTNPKQQVIRMDIYWPANAPQTFETQPTAWYNQFWKLLDDAKIPYRAHWGKYKSETPSAVEARNALYPKMEAWKKLRETCDPQNIFLPDYWKTNLGIETKTSS